MVAEETALGQNSKQASSMINTDQRPNIKFYCISHGMKMLCNHIDKNLRSSTSSEMIPKGKTIDNNKS